MADKPRFVVKPEAWNVRDAEGEDGRATVTKIAVRDAKGRFHPATNFRGTVLRG